MTEVELNAPACLLLGLVNLDAQPAALGIALQYPPIQMMARTSDVLLTSGARAERAYQQAAQFFADHQLAPQGEIEIELAIPSMVGLGSDALLGLSVARALAALHSLPHADTLALARAVGLTDAALEAQAFAQGGLLLVADDGALLEQRAIAHGDERDDWVFVLVLPCVPAGTPETLEDVRRAALHAAAPHLSAEAARSNAALWAAVDRDDIAAFAAALAQIDALTRAARAASGQPHALTDDEQTTLAVMRANGALHCARTLTGLGLYALVKGGGPSRELRRALSAHLGIFGVVVMASLCDHRGALVVTR